MACLGRIDAGTFLSSLMSGECFGRPSTAAVKRRGVAKVLISSNVEARRCQPVAEQARQVVPRARLHAGRNFLGE